jgi:restriction system protein
LESDLSLKQWLDGLKSNKPGMIDFEFPTDKLRDQYLNTVERRSWKEVKALLRKFLLPSCTLPKNDASLLHWYINWRKFRQTKPQFSEFHRRLILYARFHKIEPRMPPPWEGITWVLDLLPDDPRDAIVLECYFYAHGRFLPDGRMNGIFDAMQIIRTKCIKRPRSSRDSIQLLRREPARTLEHLVERLYSTMGFTTKLTPRQKDGGYDVLAEKRESGQRAVLHIECK